MDSLPKDENKENNPSSGDIFNTSQESAYEQAAAISSEENPQGPNNMLQAQPADEQAVNPDQPEQPPGAAPPGPFDGESPPYVENSRKKYLIILLVLGVLGFLAFMLIKSILNRSSGKKQSVTLTYWGLWEGKEILQPIIDDYIRTHPDITINYVKQDQKQYRERLQAAIERGDGPDIFRFHNTWVPMLINQLSPLPNTVLSDADFEKIFYPVAKADLKVGNNFYGIPLEIDGLVLFYNENILKSANVSVPSTWEDVRMAAPKLTVKENGKIVTSAIALGTAENVEHFSDILGLMILQNGVIPISSLFKCSDPDPKVTNCGVDALTFYHTFAETPNNSWDDTLENSIIAFAGGKAAMVFAPSWQALTIKTIKPDLPFKVAQVPQLPCDKQPCPTVNWATYWVEGVNKKGKNQAAAWEFVKYLSDASTMKKLYELELKSRILFGEPYSRMDLAQLLSSNPYIGPLISEAPSMKSFYLASRTFDGDTGLNSSLIKYMKDAVISLSQGVSAETALQTADNGFKQVFARFGLSAAQ